MSDDNLKFGTDRRDLRASIANAAGAVGRGFASMWRGMRLSVRIALVAAAVLALAGFESQNIRAGLARIFLDRADWLIAVAALGLVAGYLVAERLRAEAERGKKPEAKAYSLTSWAIFAVSLFFIFSNVSGEAMTAGKAADRNDKALEFKYEDLALARADLRASSSPLTLDADKELLRARVAEAVGWGMTDLDPDGACAADLQHHRMRTLCNEAANLRESIIRGEAMMTDRQAKEEKVARIQQEIADWTDAEETAHWQAMSSLTGGRISWDQIASWGLILVSGLLLYITGKLNDYLFEKMEDL